MILREQLEAAVTSTPADELPELIGALEAARARAWARLSTPATPGPAPQEPVGWITPERAAAIAEVPVRRIYEWAKGQRWASKPSRRCLRISERGFRRWLETRTC